MKKLLIIPILIVLLASCGDEYSDVWTQYADWRTENEEWMTEQKNLRVNGDLYYEQIKPAWNTNAYVLMHWFNDREETKDNLVPLYTSTVAVKYIGYLYNDSVFDSSFNNPDSLFTTTSGSVISGWGIALANMHVGDSCDVIIPYDQAYYASSQGIILPFSNLRFSMKLVDIPYYESKP